MRFFTSEWMNWLASWLLERLDHGIDAIDSGRAALRNRLFPMSRGRS